MSRTLGLAKMSHRPLGWYPMPRQSLDFVD